MEGDPEIADAADANVQPFYSPPPPPFFYPFMIGPVPPYATNNGII